MKIEIPYGKDKINIEIPKSSNVLLPKSSKTIDEKKLIENALNKPIDGVSFNDFISKSKEILVIVNDATRPTPTAKILEYIRPQLTEHKNIKFIVATGSHRAPTKEEYEFIFGKTYKDFKNNILVNEAREKTDMKYYGKTKRGTPVYFNKIISKIKNIIVIGGVEPHYFAGYGGGRKSFLPGIAGYETIEKNHKHSMSEKACSLILDKNPVNEDMIDAFNLIRDVNIFSIQTVLDVNKKLTAITSGSLHKSFYEATKHVKKTSCIKIKEKADIVITVAPYPMDINLYQSQKALDNSKHAVKENGIIILVSKCRKGIGDETFLNLLSSAENPQELLEKIGDTYKLGYHKAAKIAQILLKSQIWAVTDLEDKTVKKAMMKPYKDIQRAIEESIDIIQKRGVKPKLIIMPKGSLTLPYIEK